MLCINECHLPHLQKGLVVPKEAHENHWTVSCGSIRTGLACHFMDTLLPAISVHLGMLIGKVKGSNSEHDDYFEQDQ